MSNKNAFLMKHKENTSKKQQAEEELTKDIAFYQKETQRLLNTVEHWFHDIPVQYKKWENSLTEHVAPEIIYHVPGMTLINGTKRLLITPMGMYCLGGVKGRLLVSLEMSGETKNLFECRLNDSRTDFDEWAIVDCANRRKITPFNIETFFDFIVEFA